MLDRVKRRKHARRGSETLSDLLESKRARLEGVGELPASQGMVQDQILKGVRRSVLIAQYPHLVPQISKLMELRLPRKHISGPTGVGSLETTAVQHILDMVSRLYPSIDYYSKMGDQVF